MECKQVIHHLQTAATDGLDDDILGVLRQHWATCGACREDGAGFLSIWNDLDRITVPDVGSDLSPRFDAMLEGYRQGLEEGHAANSATQPGSRVGWFGQPLVQMAAAALLLVVGLVAGERWSAPSGSLVVLESEVRDLKQLVALSMLEQRSASRRLSGVLSAAEIGEPNPELLSGLLDTLDSDSSVNVRLAVVGVLGEFPNDSQVRDHVMASLVRQRSPIVQVSLIDLLVAMGEVRSVPLLEQLRDSDEVHRAVREHADWGLSVFDRGVAPRGV